MAKESSREMMFDYGGKTFTVKFPTVGQMMDIETAKLTLTGGRYGALAVSGIRSMYAVLDMVDTVAFMSVCCPAVKRYLPGGEGTDWTAQDPTAFKPLVDLYKSRIAPWYNGVLGDLTAAGNESVQEAATDAETADSGVA